MKMLRVLARNGHVELCDLSSHDLILKLTGAQTGPVESVAKRNAAYTSMRTVSKTKVLRLDQHVERIVDSVKGMRSKQGFVDTPEYLRDVLEATKLRSLVIDNIAAGLEMVKNQHGDGEIEDSRATLIVTWDDKKYDLTVHLASLQPRPVTVDVQVAFFDRLKYGANKDADWVRERQQIEQEMRPDVNEALLVADDGRILEGLSSNFFVVDHENIVRTASHDSGIVAGTIRTLVLNACEDEAQKVKYEAPLWSERDSWRAAFITSTSRLVAPISKVRPLGKDNEEITIELDSYNNEIVQKISAHVDASLERESVDVFDLEANGQ